MLHGNYLAWLSLLLPLLQLLQLLHHFVILAAKHPLLRG
jgi:hypothetical protein